MGKMSKREATRQARAMVVMEREIGTWACRPHIRWVVGVVGVDGALDCGTRTCLSWMEACEVRRALVSYWTGVILSGEEVSYV